jgi:hypothetical protein
VRLNSASGSGGPAFEERAESWSRVALTRSSTSVRAEIADIDLAPLGDKHDSRLLHSIVGAATLSLPIDCDLFEAVREANGEDRRRVARRA